MTDFIVREVHFKISDQADMTENRIVGELIRCKDCKHYDTHDHRCKQWNHGVVVADYCSRAEKKGEA